MKNKIIEMIKPYGTITVSTVALMMGIYSEFLKKQQPQIGVVDMKRMVSNLSKDLVKQYPTGQIPKEVMDHFITYIHLRIQLYGDKHKRAIFLNKQNMLVGDAYDCTDDIIEVIQNTK